MPRRSPGAVRRTATYDARGRAAQSPYSILPDVAAALRRWERERGLWPGETLGWLSTWHQVSRRPAAWAARPSASSCGIAGCCPDPAMEREQIERLLQSLPRSRRRFLRRVVAEQDERILSHRAVVASGFGSWWRDPTVWWD